MPDSPLIVKVGGSLYDLPDLDARLQRWLTEHAPRKIILVPGGGATAEAVRALDRTHRLGEEASHWLALRALSVNAAFLTALVPDACAIDGPDLAELVWEQGRVPVLDPFPFCEADDALPHTWDVTSDSIAAQLAVVAEAAELVLLKSGPPPGESVADWVAAGYVDAYLPRVLAGSDIRVRAADLRGT